MRKLRENRGLRVLVFLFPLLFFLASCVQPRVNVGDTTNLGWHQLRLGLCEDYPANSRTIESARADLQFLKTNQIYILRTAIAWDALEPQQGEFDWKFLDAFVRSAEELGITLIPYICYTPAWAARATNAPWTQPPRDLEDYARAVKKLATRYKGRIRSWEIWNEPDNREYWAGSVEEYAELLKHGSQAVRESDPGARVVCGGLAWDLQFLQRLLAQPGVLAAVDFINLHNYYETWSEDGVEDINRYVTRAQRVLKKAGATQPIWLAELGYSTFRSNNFVSYSYEAAYSYEHTPQFQSVTLFRMLVPLMASTQVRLAAWYRIHDLLPTQDIIGDVNNRHLGILFANAQPKPALAAFHFFQNLFEDGFIPADDRLQLTTSINSDADVHGFVRRDGSLVILAWLKVVEPEHFQPLRLDPSDSREQRLSISVPPEFEAQGLVYNQEGEILGSTTIDSKTRTVELTLRGNELRVLVLKKR